MSSSESFAVVRVPRPFLRQVLERGPAIWSLFSVQLGQQLAKDYSDVNFVYLPLESDDFSALDLAKISIDVQNYVDSMVAAAEPDGTQGGEDSSYDSDFEGEDREKERERGHHDVSRTTSDTLGAEYADYVSSASASAHSAQYAAKVEFALKLGYTEKQVQASLAKLGPNPGQNELLEELIKLGAQSPRVIEDPEPSEGLPESWCTSPLRHIVIDGSNVAMSHGNKTVFSCRGIKIAVDWFRVRGHRKITVFVPKWRKEAPRPDNPITDQELLTELERERILVYTPSRQVGGKRTVCYDDRYVLRLAVDEDGIVVSNDSYRDLVAESAEFKRVVEERTLMYSFVNDRFMPPDDPLGRSGPTLENFLRLNLSKNEPLPPPCPYGKKCTYGNKCKYHHPERGPLHKSVTERLVENARRHGGGVVRGKSLSVPLAAEQGAVRKATLSRTRSGVPTHAQPFDDKVGKSWSVENVRCMQPPPPQQPSDSQTNLHRKLQRQLTLNPSCDPRLWDMRGYVPVWDHTGVTRMASAPDPARPPASSTTPRMASDPTLYRAPTTEEARRKLHYHLASIFPEEQVLAAMRSLPDETRPQEICAAILAMFPNP